MLICANFFSVLLTGVLGTVSPPLLLMSTCLFMMVEPKRSTKILVRAGLIFAVWASGSLGFMTRTSFEADKVEVEELPVEAEVDIRADLGYTFMPDLARQCPAMTSNLSMPPWLGLPIRETTSQRTSQKTRIRDQIYEVVTTPETVFMVVLAACLKAGHDVFAFGDDL